LPEVAGQGFVEVLDEVVRSGQPYTARCEPINLARRSDGALEEHFFDFVFQPLVDDAGKVGGVAAVGYDVTELSRARQDAEVANRAKDEFLAMLGHELRNPLAPILTALQLLRLRGIEAGERERQVIERQVQHLVSLVDDLLDVSRIMRGKIQINARPIDISEVVAKAIETTSPLLEQKGHGLQIDVPRRGLVVDGDADRLAQVVANLLTNAAKYTENGGRISVHAAAVAGEVVLRVRDTGIGIGPEMLPRVFDLFVQEPQALDRAQGGLGLGLAIVRSLVNLHGGRVAAHSDGSGRGSEFVVALPRSTTQVADAEEQVALTYRTAETVQRILVVDDNCDAAMMLADALTAQGHVARVALNGVDALQIAAQFRPDVALLDVGLPVMDGYELARRLGDDPELRGLKMIAVTGYGQEQDRRRSAVAGFSAHLIKPVDLEQLRAVVEGPGADAPTT
jgi:signal transduction histidine kinase/ActR/RegA family two-component response regulator